jgi:hypothetical protein
MDQPTQVFPGMGVGGNGDIRGQDNEDGNAHSFLAKAVFSDEVSDIVRKPLGAHRLNKKAVPPRRKPRNNLSPRGNTNLIGLDSRLAVRCSSHAFLLDDWVYLPFGSQPSGRCLQQ